MVLRESSIAPSGASMIFVGPLPGAWSLSDLRTALPATVPPALWLGDIHRLGAALDAFGKITSFEFGKHFLVDSISELRLHRWALRLLWLAGSRGSVLMEPSCQVSRQS